MSLEVTISKMEVATALLTGMLQMGREPGYPCNIRFANDENVFAEAYGQLGLPVLLAKR